MMSAMNAHHLRVAVETFWMTWFCSTGVISWTSERPESWFSLPRREGGGVKALRILLEADLNRWIMKSCWSWNASKLIIQTWPCCWAHAWCSRASLWSSTWLPLWSLWKPWTCAIELTLNTWVNEESLERLSLGRWLPNTEDWTNFVRTSEGLWWVPMFQVTWLLHWECPESTNVWARCALTSLKCLDVKPLSCLLMYPVWEWFSPLLKESLIWVPWWSAWSPMNQLLLES